MGRLAALLMMLVLCTPLHAQSTADTARGAALRNLASSSPAERVEGITWIATKGRYADAEFLVQRLTDENPQVRHVAEQGLWVLWSRSGDKAIDALLAKGVAEMEAHQIKRAIATFSEVVRRKPEFAEGWNKRATAYYLAGDFRRSLADCDEVMKRNRYHFGALAGYGQIYFQLEQYTKSVEYWKRAIRVNPNMENVEMSLKSVEKLLEERRRQAI